MKLLFSSLLGLALLTGCTAGEHTRHISAIYGDDGKAPPLMTNVNIVAWAGFNELPLRKVSGIANTALYASGVRKGSSNARYRYIAFSSPYLENEGFLWKAPGSQQYLNGAMIPDQIGELKRGDILEVRSIASWDSLVNFHTTGEGQVVTRVLCRKASPDWQKCHDALPKFHKIQAAGPTGTPFLPSVKDYGFTFSQYYDDEGKLLKPLPKADI